MKPDNITDTDAACVVGDALKAYTALFYQANVVSGQSIVIGAAARGCGVATTQLAIECGLTVIAVGSTDEEISFLRSMQPAPHRVVDLRNKKVLLLEECLQQTGGLGVDVFFDNSVELHNNNDKDVESCALTKSDIISCLGVGGRWITTVCDLQLHSSDSMLMSLKCASVHFLFEDTWTLSRSSQGKYLHILKDIMDKVSKGVFKPFVHSTVDFDNCPSVLENLDQGGIIGRILVRVGKLV